MFDITPWIGAIASVATGFLTGVAGWLVARSKGQTELAAALATAEVAAEAVRAEHSGPNWQIYLNRLEVHFEKRMNEQDLKIGDQSRQIELLTGVVGKLREHIEESKARYSAALRHIFDWRRAHPETVDKIPVPAEIADDFRL